jgi:hypothetical protein
VLGLAGAYLAATALSTMFFGGEAGGSGGLRVGHRDPGSGGVRCEPHPGPSGISDEPHAVPAG